MTAAQIEPVVKASLRALVEPPRGRTSGSPRDALVAVSDAWADDGAAWQLARRLVRQAEIYLEELEHKAAAEPIDPPADRLLARARYAHLVAVTLYRDLRMPGRRQGT